LKPSEAQQASGLINLSRQLGGSFGIAIITTYLDHQLAIHRADLVTTTYAANPEFIHRQQQTAAALMAHGYTAFQAHQGSLALLNQLLNRQASMLSYNDAWMLLLETFVVISPAVLILRKPRGQKGGGGGGGDAH